MMTRLTVVGSLNMDLVIRSSHIPKPGETIIGSDFQTIPGGKGANQAVAAAKLGAQVSMVGRVGGDPFADILLENLKAEGVDSTYILREKHSASGVALIVVDDHGENSIVVASGANMRLSEADIDWAREVISTSDVLLLQLEVPLAVVTKAAQIAHEHNVIVILNPAPAREIPAQLLALVDVLVPNESETGLLTGLTTSSLLELEEAASKLLQFGVRTVVITLGERGALLAIAERVELYEPFIVHPVDTTAAGDAFVAAFAFAYGAGKSLPEAIRWGNAAGGLATMRFGAQTSLPNQMEVSRLLNGEEAGSILRSES